MNLTIRQRVIVIRKSLIVNLIIWFAAYLRFPALFANHFHADEALFASWARLIAVWRDPLLLTQAVDKPPLLFYLQALFYPLLGPMEWAARLPGWIASLLLVPLVAVLAWHLYRRKATAVAAALIITLSPLAIQFSATAFLDPLLTTLLAAALLATVAKRPGWAGIWFGLALATKYQALLFLPLLLGFAWLWAWPKQSWKRWIAALVVVLGLLLFWTALRDNSSTLWTIQIQNFGGIRPIWSWEIWPRFTSWAFLWGDAWGSRVIALWVVVAVLLLLGRALLRGSDIQMVRQKFVNDMAGHGQKTGPERHLDLVISSESGLHTAVDLLLLIFVGGYMALHWLLAIPVWDRYLLPLLPLLALILGRTIVISGDLLAKSGNWERKWALTTMVLLMGLILLSGAWEARNGRLPIGGYPEADHGAWQVAEFLEDAPYGTVLYDHWYSWHWRYHLFDKRVYVSWFPHPAALVEDVSAFGEGDETRYVVLPATAVAQPVQREIQNAGYKLQPVFQSSAEPGIVLYRLSK